MSHYDPSGGGGGGGSGAGGGEKKDTIDGCSHTAGKENVLRPPPHVRADSFSGIPVSSNNKNKKRSGRRRAVSSNSCYRNNNNNSHGSSTISSGISSSLLSSSPSSSSQQRHRDKVVSAEEEAFWNDFSTQQTATSMKMTTKKSSSKRTLAAAAAPAAAVEGRSGEEFNLIRAGSWHGGGDSPEQRFSGFVDKKSQAPRNQQESYQKTGISSYNNNNNNNSTPPTSRRASLQRDLGASTNSGHKKDSTGKSFGSAGIRLNNTDTGRDPKRDEVNSWFGEGPWWWEKMAAASPRAGGGGGKNFRPWYSNPSVMDEEDATFAVQGGAGGGSGNGVLQQQESSCQERCCGCFCCTATEEECEACCFSLCDACWPCSTSPKNLSSNNQHPLQQPNRRASSSSFCKNLGNRSKDADENDSDDSSSVGSFTRFPREHPRGGLSYHASTSLQQAQSFSSNYLTIPLENNSVTQHHNNINHNINSDNSWYPLRNGNSREAYKDRKSRERSYNNSSHRRASSTEISRPNSLIFLSGFFVSVFVFVALVVISGTMDSGGSGSSSSNDDDDSGLDGRDGVGISQLQYQYNSWVLLAGETRQAHKKPLNSELTVTATSIPPSWTSGQERFEPLSVSVYDIPGRKCPDLTGPPVILQRMQNLSIPVQDYKYHYFFLNAGSYIDLSVTQIQPHVTDYDEEEEDSVTPEGSFTNVYLLQGTNHLQRIQGDSSSKDEGGFALGAKEKAFVYASPLPRQPISTLLPSRSHSKSSIGEISEDDGSSKISSFARILYEVLDSDIYVLVYDNPSALQKSRLTLQYNITLSTYNVAGYTPVCQIFHDEHDDIPYVLPQVVQPSRGPASCTVPISAQHSSCVIVQAQREGSKSNAPLTTMAVTAAKQEEDDTTESERMVDSSKQAEAYLHATVFDGPVVLVSLSGRRQWVLLVILSAIPFLLGDAALIFVLLYKKRRWDKNKNNYAQLCEGADDGESYSNHCSEPAYFYGFCPAPPPPPPATNEPERVLANDEESPSTISESVPMGVAYTQNVPDATCSTGKNLNHKKYYAARQHEDSLSSSSPSYYSFNYGYPGYSSVPVVVPVPVWGAAGGGGGELMTGGLYSPEQQHHPMMMMHPMNYAAAASNKLSSAGVRASLPPLPRAPSSDQPQSDE